MTATVTVLIAWDAVADADRYAVYVWPEGFPFTELETVAPRCAIEVPLRTMTFVFVTSRQGQLESLSSEEMHIYVGRW